MFEIVAAVVGVVLAAIIGLKIRGHRNLITYEITKIGHKVAIKDNKIVPYEPLPSEWPTRIESVHIRLVNRGWKNISDVKLHAEGDFHPFSIEKTASSISIETISIGPRGNSLEFAIDFVPTKEELEISFSLLEPYPNVYKLTGAGSAYKVESIHYYKGYLQALSFFRTLFMYVAAGIVIGSIIGAVIKGARSPVAITQPKASTARPGN